MISRTEKYMFWFPSTSRLPGKLFKLVSLSILDSFLKIQFFFSFKPYFKIKNFIWYKLDNFRVFVKLIYLYHSSRLIPFWLITNCRIQLLIKSTLVIVNILNHHPTIFIVVEFKLRYSICPSSLGKKCKFSSSHCVCVCTF